MINLFTYLSLESISLGQLYQQFVIILFSIIILFSAYISIIKLPASHNMKLRFKVVLISYSIVLLNSSLFFVFLSLAKYSYNTPAFLLPIFSIIIQLGYLFAHILLPLALIVPEYVHNGRFKRVMIFFFSVFACFIVVLFAIALNPDWTDAYVLLINKGWILIIAELFFVISVGTMIILSKLKSNLFLGVACLNLFLANGMYFVTLIQPKYIKYLVVYSLLIILANILVEIYIFYEIIRALRLSNSEVQKLNEELENKIQERTQDLFNSNKELFQANYMLHQEKEKLNAIIRNIDEGIIVSNISGYILLINDSAYRILGISDKHIGAMVKEVIQDNDYIKDMNGLVLKKVRKISKDIIVELEGEERHIQFISTLSIDSKDNIIGIITLLRDVSKEIEIERLKTGFLRTISHELKTPLTTIIGFSETLASERRGQLNKEQKEFIDIIVSEGEHLHRLISNLLEFTKISSSKGSLMYEEFNLRTLVIDIMESFLPIAESKGIKLSIDEGGANLPSIQADKAKLQRAFLNVIKNAIDYTNEGEVTVSFHVAKKKIVTMIKDTGVGIPENEKARVFDTFFHFDQKKVTGYKSGLGLGLAIAKNFIQIHDGKVWLESEKDKGSTFFIELPIVR
jgi:PAS domain S-box-containing protein